MKFLPWIFVLTLLCLSTPVKAQEEDRTSAFEESRTEILFALSCMQYIPPPNINISSGSQIQQIYKYTEKIIQQLGDYKGLKKIENGYLIIGEYCSLPIVAKHNAKQDFRDNNCYDLRFDPLHCESENNHPSPSHPTSSTFFQHWFAFHTRRITTLLNHEKLTQKSSELGAILAESSFDKGRTIQTENCTITAKVKGIGGYSFLYQITHLFEVGRIGPKRYKAKIKKITCGQKNGEKNPS